MFLMTGCTALGFLCFMILEDYLHKLYLKTHCKPHFYQQYLHTNCTWNHLQKLPRFPDVYIARKCRNSIISFVYTEKQYAMKESVAVFLYTSSKCFNLHLISSTFALPTSHSLLQKFLYTITFLPVYCVYNMSQPFTF